MAIPSRAMARARSASVSSTRGSAGNIVDPRGSVITAADAATAAMAINADLVQDDACYPIRDAC